jgi:hypothetical protein
MEERAKASGRLRALVPDVLRSEPQFRLLCAGQVLSLVGDRARGDCPARPVPGLRADRRSDLRPRRPQARRHRLGRGSARRAGDRRRPARRRCRRSLVARRARRQGIYGSAEAFFQPAFTGLLPQTVSHPGQLQPANAVRGLSFSIASIAGPALAGALVAGIGAGAAMLFDAGSFAVSVACLVRLRPRVAEQGTEETPPPFVTVIRAGWREVRTRSWVIAGLGAMCAYAGIVLPAVYVLGPVTVSHEHGGPGAWAAVGVAFGAGCILGDMFLLRIRPRHALRTDGVARLLASS